MDQSALLQVPINTRPSPVVIDLIKLQLKVMNQQLELLRKSIKISETKSETNRDISQLPGTLSSSNYFSNSSDLSVQSELQKHPSPQISIDPSPNSIQLLCFH